MNKIIVALCIALLGLTGCKSNKVNRVDENKTVDLSGRWNDTDSRLVSQEMVTDVLGRAWIQEHMDSKGAKPVVIVGLVKNKTSEHINTDIFINDIERELINSGKVKLVQGGEGREELRRERADQQDFASKETVKKWGQERGADYILQGTVGSITDSNNKEKLVFYQVDLFLTNIETNEKVWIGNKKIKKTIK